MICDLCGATLQIGDFPFCPHGRAAVGIEPDDVPGGFTVENGFDTPQTFYSRSEHEAALAARGLEIRAKWAGPNDKHLKRWDAPSEKTLRDAAVLLSRSTERAQEQRAERDRIAREYPITVTDISI